MRRGKIINGELLRALASLGHGDFLAIADCGLPIPKEAWKIDLALVHGVPSFQEVVQAVAKEIIVQRFFIAEEMRSINPKQHAFVRTIFAGIASEEISHANFKKLLHEAKVVIRTGEATPYSNIILEVGIDF